MLSSSTAIATPNRWTPQNGVGSLAKRFPGRVPVRPRISWLAVCLDKEEAAAREFRFL